MKTTNFIRLTILVLAIAGLSLTGCKKDKNSDPSADSSSLQQLAGDEESVESAMDESMNDVNNFLSGGKLKSSYPLPCGATVDSTPIVNDTNIFYITFNGLNCNKTRMRTGQVVIKMKVGTQWDQQGATVIVKHINFTITKVLSGISITLNGIKVHQNVSGGLIGQLGNGMSAIVHRTWGQLNVTFHDGTTKSWSLDRHKTFTGNPPDSLILTTNGLGSADGYDNLLVWGTNRQGEKFYTQVIQPVVHKQIWDWDPITGIKKHSIPADSKSATLTFGYNNHDQPVTGDERPTKYKVDWQKKNRSGTIYLRL